MPLPTVFATSVPLIAPAKFKTPAIRMATHGRSTRVEITVATAFAVSWKPFMKSNASASAMRSNSADGMSKLGMLDHEATQHVGDVLAFVGHPLHRLVDPAPGDDPDGILRAVKQVHHPLAKEHVGLVLEAVE